MTDQLQRAWMIDCFAAREATAADCYPDFCGNSEKARAIAPEFTRHPRWAVRFDREETI
jgi:hypothetical protein